MLSQAHWIVNKLKYKYISDKQRSRSIEKHLSCNLWNTNSIYTKALLFTLSFNAKGDFSLLLVPPLWFSYLVCLSSLYVSFCTCVSTFLFTCLYFCLFVFLSVCISLYIYHRFMDSLPLYINKVKKNTDFPWVIFFWPTKDFRDPKKRPPEKKNMRKIERWFNFQWYY